MNPIYVKNVNKYEFNFQCTGPCGNGIQSRTVYCSVNGKKIDMRHCERSQLSELYRRCKIQDCDGTDTEYHEHKDNPDEDSFPPGMVAWIVCVIIAIIVIIAAVIIYFTKKQQLYVSRNGLISKR